MKTKNRFIFSLIIIFILLIFLKIDFRLISEITCCGDDFDYYIHAKTIVIDGDLDYSNNLPDDPYFYKYQDKLAPKGFVGSGILSSPFLLIGYGLDKLFNPSQIMNFEILVYSFSSLFYFVLSIIMFNSCLKKLNIKENSFFVLILFFGSGLPYFVFERYSMAHSYEIFVNTFIFYLIVNLNFEIKLWKLNTFCFLIPFVVMLGLLVKWTNYYLLFLPYFYILCLKEFDSHKFNISRNIFTYISIVFSSLFYYFVNLNIYNRFFLDPRIAYGETKDMTQLLNVNENIMLLLTKYTRDTLNIFFGFEFGLFWFSPIVFLILPIMLLNIIDRKFKIFLILLGIFIQTFGVVIIWQSTASSYGYRYLLSLIPLCMVYLVSISKNKKYKYFKYYLYPSSIFASLSILFFETNKGTQLSLVEIENSFGKITRYTQPDYLIGYLKSFSNFESYLVIFVTSFFGLIIFKLLISVFGYENLLNILESNNLPVTNEDFLQFYTNTYQLEYSKILITFLFLALCSFYIEKSIND